MAEIVLALATSHTPQLSVADWRLLQTKDETDPTLDYPALTAAAKSDIGREITAERYRERFQACQRALRVLGDTLREARPDVVVTFGDDQHEQFLDDNMPTFAVYHGRDMTIAPRTGPLPEWKKAEQRGWAETAPVYSNHTALAEHLIGWLSDHDFDIARTNRLREGVGHAFSFLYRRLLPGSTLPMVPVMVNTYYPPNQPTPGRCYALGQGVRKAIESWDSDARVAVMASGGLSHFVVDEDIDRATLKALADKDTAALRALPREKLRSGTSEILNWIALGGFAEPMEMTLVDYVPGYRSPAGTGCGMGFAYWRPTVRGSADKSPEAMIEDGGRP
ncbi:MAG: hypothetical protein OXF11_20590 [Deltaproteobacteria bacterium]|nr:hypothetical protein [Deltaproteobacteria bacterium]